ncbi:uncharacterized protein DMENIID0001_087120 [Sergentomyia squamirostris]
MFTCLWQLWDWLDPPPLFTTATMESKKLQQLQQANSHMAPQPMPQTKAPSYHTATGEYRPTHSPVFQNHPQYQSLSSNFAQINMTKQPHLHVKPIGPGSQYGSGGFSQAQTPTQHLNHYHGEQLYQNNTRERVYQQGPLRQHFPGVHQHINPSSQLQQQYQQLQQAKLQAQLQTQSDALMQQQRTFAMRQQLNPPIPQSHYHLQSQTSLNQIPVQVQPQSQSIHRSAPPSSLNLTNQFQPAGTAKLPPDSHYGTTTQSNQLSPQSSISNVAILQNHKAQSQAIYQQNQLIQQQMIQNKLQQQMQKSPQDQIIIQQNNPGSVMNQACQTQISGQVPKGKPLQNNDKTPSPSHAPLDRKKSGGTPIALKSPVTKRPVSSPVTLSGWLYKQGSEGLKVWRKRWFVLSEYCLFYYKGPEEEKVLGSILLPSYRVAACSPEDKIYRKYAFKCEHVNMRTYWLSAETAESMGQWVRALTAATMMQCSSESDQTPQPSMSSSLNPSGENSDSGIHTYQSQQSKIGVPLGHGPLTPASDVLGGGGSSAGGSATGGPQPLYANAPPKPKRANDGGYSSPSPEHSVERYDGGFETHHLEPNQRRLDVKSPLSHQSPDSLYEVRRQMAKSPDPAMAQRMQQMHLDGAKSPNPVQQVRSPYPNDSSYGSDLSQALLMRQQMADNLDEVYGSRAPTSHRFDEYSGRQIYGEATATERELQMRIAQQKYLNPQQATALYPSNERRTPDTYGRSRQVERRNFSDYEDIYNLQQQAMGDLGSYRRPMSPVGYQNNKNIPERFTPNYLEPNTAAQHVQMRARPVQSTLIPRPHSADFLEYEAREAAQMQAEPARAPRPKSSLDINRAPDSYYYSEASYAEKLRQSALYQAKPATMPHRYNNNPFAAEMGGANTIPRDGDYGQYNQRMFRQQQMQQLQKGFLSPQQDQFLRSASARLPRKEEEVNGRDSERRREESMKRLLEWKQRMLQSPLTRKGAATLSTVATMAPSKSLVPMSSGLQRSRSETHANAGYNSYSSDDEDGAHFSPAGRSSSPRTLSSSSALVSQKQIVQNSPVEVSQTDNSRIMPSSADTCQSPPITYTPVYAQKSVTDTLFSTKLEPPTFGGKLSLKRQPDDIETSVDDDEKVDEQPCTSLTPTPTLTHSDLGQNTDESGPSDQDKAFEYTDDDLDEALLAEIADPNDSTEQDEPKTPTNPIPTSEDFGEGYYLPMTPKKSLLSSSTSESSIVRTLTSADNSEENTYVEMTKGKLDSILADDVKSNYELMCLNSNSKLESEPVYMELSQLKNSPERPEESPKPEPVKKSAMKKYQSDSRKFSTRMDLPDILKASQNVLKSDSSDADDEASKDFDGLDMKSRTRFSLSDTFRPASYYLGASTPLAECADSSDSEIASPPPIPTSPPPMEELNTEEIFSSENYDTVKRKEKQTLNNSYDQIIKLSNSDFHLNKTEGHKTSRLSLPDQFAGKKSKIDIAMPDYISLSTYNVEGKMYAGSINSCNTDDGSNTSSDYDLYNKLKLESPSFSSDVLYNSDTSLQSKYSLAARQRNSESETESVELRHSSSGMTDLEMERRLKRRPLSEDSFSEIESIENDFRETINADLDQYLNKLTTNNPYVYNSSEQTSWMHESLSKIGEIHYIKPPEVFCSENDNFYENLTTMRKDSLEKPDSFQIGQLVSPSAISNPLRPDSALSNTNGTYYDSLEDKPQVEELPVVTTDANVSPLKEKNLSIHNAKCASEDLKSEFSIELSNSVTLSSADVDQQSTCTAFDLTRRSPVHSRGNSNVSDGSAPYYYSDLVSRSNQDITLGQKLNNQRDVGVIRKTGISHIHNPIHQRTPSGGTLKDKQQQGLITADGRSISAEILNVATKEQLIDRRNLFGVEQHESRKIEKNICKEGSFPTKLNSNSRVNSGEHETASRVHKANNNNTHIDSPCNSNPIDGSFCNMTPLQSPDVSAGDQLWEEDTLWRESLRRVSHRHARSLDDLDRICHAKRLIQDTKSRVQLTRDVTYVNDTVAASSTQSRSSLRKKVYRKKASDRKASKQLPASITSAECDENDVYVQLAVDEQSGDVYETLRDDRMTFSPRPSDVDREKIRQWDAMSSGMTGNVLGNLSDTAGIRGTLSSGSDATDVQASLSVQNVKNVQPSEMSVNPDDIQRHMSNNHEERFPGSLVRGYEHQQAQQQQPAWPMKKSTSQREIDQLERENAIRSLDMSAGDLLSRTHEELVLLLIQLRRQNSATARAIEQCCTDIHDVQNRIRTSDGQTKMDNIARLDTLKQQLVDLEKQYEKSKPLVNLVDNMVKLGSLYRGTPTANRQPGNESVTLDRLEFNQRVQERRLLQEERRHWDRLSPNHTELQTKVQQLYQLDQLLQEESGTLQSLQRDKEDLERALGGLRARMQNGVGPPIAIEAARKQQHALERELSRVHQLLAENSKKLEQTVAGNARLEQELLVLRQKLQASRDSRGSQTALNTNSNNHDTNPYSGGASAVLESDILELRRVQQLVGDMQRQRQELSQAVKQLTENSNTLYQQIKPSDHQSNSKKRLQNSSWMETDLDSMISSDQSLNQMGHIEHVSTNPFLNHNLYVETNTGQNDAKHQKIYNNHHESSDGIESSGMESDDLLEGNHVNGLSIQDKQEIKTVRIVKRESERRQRDRERTNSSSQNLDQVLEEETHLPDDYLNFSRSKSLPRGYSDNGYDPFKTVESLKSPRVTSKGNTIYTAGPSIPGTSGKYTEFYNHTPQISNHYPVSMTERNDDPSKFYTQNSTDKNYKGTYGSAGELSGLKNKTESIQSLTKSIGELSPVFQSEAAKQIIYEMSGNTSEENGEKVPLASKHRRAVPKEKRRHNTAPSNVIVKTMQQIQSENDMNRNNTNWRARDDLDMEVALRPRSNAPDVVRSALGPREKISENTIDKLLAAPSKIVIPERYIPEQPPELSPEEKKRRQEKVEAIKKMLSEAPLNPSNDNVSAPPSQISAEKKQREHLLQLNQILAQQVMQMSKIVAEKAMATLPSKVAEFTKNDIPEDDQPSPPEPLPLYQQRDNYFS